MTLHIRIDSAIERDPPYARYRRPPAYSTRDTTLHATTSR